MFRSLLPVQIIVVSNWERVYILAPKLSNFPNFLGSSYSLFSSRSAKLGFPDCSRQLISSCDGSFHRRPPRSIFRRRCERLVRQLSRSFGSMEREPFFTHRQIRRATPPPTHPSSSKKKWSASGTCRRWRVKIRPRSRTLPRSSSPRRWQKRFNFIDPSVLDVVTKFVVFFATHRASWIVFSLKI